MSYLDNLQGRELSDKQRRALEMSQAGATDQEIADALGYASANGAGNVRRQAEVIIGLRQPGDNQATSTARPQRTVRKVTDVEDPVQELRDAVERIRVKRNEMSDRLEQLRMEAELDEDGVIAAETSRLQEIVAKAEADLERFTAQDDATRTAFIETRQRTAKAALEGQEDDLESGVAKADRQLRKAEAMLAIVELEDDADDDDDDDSSDENTESQSDE